MRWLALLLGVALIVVVARAQVLSPLDPNRQAGVNGKVLDMQGAKVNTVAPALYPTKEATVTGQRVATSTVNTALRPNQFVVSLVEGWRGEICHVAITDARGAFARYKVVDPSFHNWQGLAMALRGGPISDFPLINKSFNLSYAGHDL